MSDNSQGFCTFAEMGFKRTLRVMLVAVGILAAAGGGYSQNRSSKTSSAPKTPSTTQKASKTTKVGAAAVWGEKTAETDNPGWRFKGMFPLSDRDFERGTK